MDVQMHKTCAAMTVYSVFLKDCILLPRCLTTSRACSPKTARARCTPQNSTTTRGRQQPPACRQTQRRQACALAQPTRCACTQINRRARRAHNRPRPHRPLGAVGVPQRAHLALCMPSRAMRHVPCEGTERETLDYDGRIRLGRALHCGSLVLCSLVLRGIYTPEGSPIRAACLQLPQRAAKVFPQVLRIVWRGCLRTRRCRDKGRVPSRIRAPRALWGRATDAAGKSGRQQHGRRVGVALPP